MKDSVKLGNQIYKKNCSVIFALRTLFNVIVVRDIFKQHKMNATYESKNPATRLSILPFHRLVSSCQKLTHHRLTTMPCMEG